MVILPFFTTPITGVSSAGRQELPTTRNKSYLPCKTPKRPCSVLKPGWNWSIWKVHVFPMVWCMPSFRIKTGNATFMESIWEVTDSYRNRNMKIYKPPASIKPAGSLSIPSFPFCFMPKAIRCICTIWPPIPPTNRWSLCLRHPKSPSWNSIFINSPSWLCSTINRRNLWPGSSNWWSVHTIKTARTITEVHWVSIRSTE